jgi:hypothetical protein
VYRLASALADAWELVKGGRDVLTSVVEIDDFRDFPRVNPEILDEFVDSLPDPWRPVGDEDDLAGLDYTGPDQVLLEQGKHGIGVTKGGVMNGWVVPATAAFAVQCVDDEDLGFAPAAVKTMMLRQASMASPLLRPRAQSAAINAGDDPSVPEPGEILAGDSHAATLLEHSSSELYTGGSNLGPHGLDITARQQSLGHIQRRTE